MTAKTPALHFANERSLSALRCPPGRDFVEAWHESVKGFGVRVMPPDAGGNIRMTYLCRYTAEELDPATGTVKKKDKKERLGLVSALPGEPAITYDFALEQVLAKRRVRTEQARTGAKTRLTLGDCWKRYAQEKQVNRGATLEKDTGTYERHLKPFEGRFIDTLDYQFWSGLVSDMKAGTFVVGTMKDDLGNEVPDIRGPVGSATLLAILNVASNLFEIARKYSTNKGEHYNPAREAKSLVGTPNKRKTHIPVKDLGLALRAARQLIQPVFYDLFFFYIMTGLRRSLVMQLDFPEINFDTGTYIIDPRKRGTKRRGKDIPDDPEPILLPLSAPVLDMLRRRLEFAPNPKGPVWYSPVAVKGKKSASGAITDPRKSWQPIEDAIGGRHFTAHDLRRTFATAASVATDGKDLFALGLLMLHSGSTLASTVGLPAITVEYINTTEAQTAMRRTANTVADYILGLMANKTEAKSDAAVKLPDYIERALAEE